jgi:hypothetical protein
VALVEWTGTNGNILEHRSGDTITITLAPRNTAHPNKRPRHTGNDGQTTLSFQASSGSMQGKSTTLGTSTVLC